MIRYIATLWDGEKIIMNEEQAEKAMEHKLKGTSFKFKGELIDGKAISHVRKMPNSTPEYYALPEKIDNPVKKETLERVNREMAQKFGYTKP